MFPLMDGVFIKRRCYLKLGDGAILSSIRLRADSFFRHWLLKDAALDDEGWVRARAVPSLPHSGPVSEVFLRIDPMSGLLLDYRYTDHGIARAFTLVDGDYHEVTAESGGTTAPGDG
jgi:hypothetical protein